MNNPLDPALMDPAERILEIAEILATAITRRRRRTQTMSPRRKIQDSGFDCPPQASVHGFDPRPKGEKR